MTTNNERMTMKSERNVSTNFEDFIIRVEKFSIGVTQSEDSEPTCVSHKFTMTKQINRAYVTQSIYIRTPRKSTGLKITFSGPEVTCLL